MKKYLLKKAFLSVLTLVIIIIILIWIFINMPADYISALGPSSDISLKNQVRHELFLDKPKKEQFRHWVKKVFSGNLGYSFMMGQPIDKIIKSTMKNSYKLYIYSFLAAILFSIPIGVLSSSKPYLKSAKVLSILSVVGICIPSFVLAALFKFVFINNNNMQLFDFMNKFSSQGYMRYSKLMLRKVLPFLVMFLLDIALMTKYVKTSMVEILKENYIKTARSKGLKEKVVLYRHALKNAAVTIVTVIGVTVNTIISYGVITEYCFGFPGMGMLTYSATIQRDYPLMMGISIVWVVILISINFSMDILYCFIDPRIRYDKL